MNWVSEMNQPTTYISRSFEVVSQFYYLRMVLKPTRIYFDNKMSQGRGRNPCHHFLGKQVPHEPTSTKRDKNAGIQMMVKPLVMLYIHNDMLYTCTTEPICMVFEL